MGDAGSTMVLACRVGTRTCALDLSDVREIMRPLPVEPLRGAPLFVRGVSVLRGSVAPVVSSRELLGVSRTAPDAGSSARFVALESRGRRYALEVDAVIGVRRITNATLRTLPSLAGATAEGIVSAVGSLDDSLLEVLRAGCVVPDDTWAALEAS